MQSMTITTKVEELRSWTVYSIKHYVMKFVSYLRQAVVFSGNSGFFHQYNLNIVESVIKHYKPSTKISLLNTI